MGIDDPPGQKGGQGSGQGHPGGGPVLRHRAGRHMDMQIVVLELLRLHREQGLDQTDRDPGRLLHHVPELPGDQ